MNTAIIIFALLGAACSFPKVAEFPPFKTLHVSPDKQIDPNDVLPRILNGREATPHSIPHQAYLVVTARQGYRWSCGGSLISSRYVITAGHCVDDAVSAEVYLGAHNIQQQESNRVILTSTNLRRHESYDATHIHNDIGLIELPRAVELNQYINVVSIPRRGSNTNFEGVSARISGWGLTANGSPSSVLLEVDSHVMSNTDCKRYFSNVAATEICTSGDGGVGACNGDSGGPLIANNQLVGIVSYGAIGCERGYPSGFTRVTSYLDWIEQHSDVKL